LLERPISTLTLTRSVQVALRSRRRQYQVRDLVAQLANLNQTLERRVARRTAEAVERAQKLRLLSAELSLAEEAERRRIGELLHEDLQQLLVVARMQLAALCRTQDVDQREPIAREIADVLERSFQLTRSLSVELAPPVLYEHGLAAALEWLAAETRKNYNIEVTVEADSSANPKTADVRIFLFRAVRELLLNSAKHAGGSAVHIKMQHRRPGRVRIIVNDEGPGFDPNSLDDKRTGSQTVGLPNIRDRASSFGGRVPYQQQSQARDPNNPLAPSRLRRVGQSRHARRARFCLPSNHGSGACQITVPTDGEHLSMCAILQRPRVPLQANP